MIKNIFFTAAILLSLGASTSVQAQKKKNQNKTTAAKNDVKFLDDISIETAPVQTQASDPKAAFSESLFTSKKVVAAPTSPTAGAIENANELQFKYALLMDIEVEQVSNLNLFKSIDDWFGTRYRYGGESKDGIDCSALMQNLYTSVYGVTIPRTAREQYNFSRKISRTEIKEGDLIFFNTTGGVSHVGMYLQNNKFVHASKNGVTISDMYEEYWMKKFVGVGRLNDALLATAISNP